MRLTQLQQSILQLDATARERGLANFEGDLYEGEPWRFEQLAKDYDDAAAFPDGDSASAWARSANAAARKIRRAVRMEPPP